MRIPKYSEIDHINGIKYQLDEDIKYTSYRYGKSITLYEGMLSDGASGAVDVNSSAWWFHDKLCNNCVWDDGTKLTNWQASHVLGDILKEEGRWVRARTWFWSTWLLGCSGCKDNGWW